MITQFWDAITDVVGGFIDALVSAFTGITSLFYDTTEGFTIIGQLLLIALGMSIVYFGFRFIRNLIKNRG